MIEAQHSNKATLEYDAEYRGRVERWAAQQKAQQQQYQQQQYQQQYQQRQPQQQPQQQQQSRQPSEQSMTWAAKNPWFGKDDHRDMTAIAYATHETMIRDEGIKPDSDEYYEKLNATMTHRFPEYFESINKDSKPSSIVAPVSRKTGAKSRTVRLTASQRSVAKALGVSDKDYARQLVKENNRGE